MRVLAAPDKFKGTATAAEVAAAIAGVGAQLGWDTVEAPMADGGEGTLAAFGGANRTSVVRGPLGEPVAASWRLAGRFAVVEMAEASGLSLAGGAEGNDPIAASTAGTGELIAEAVEAGARHIIVGVGGSASTDGGLAALRAMYPLQRLRGVDIEVACDVTTTFVEAAATFGPQKGASPAQVELLRRRLERLAQVYEQEYGVDVRQIVGGGAAGGLAGGLAAVGALPASGFEVIATEIDLYSKVEAADLVIGGEGQLDPATFQGKVVGGLADLCRAAEVPLLVVAGQVEGDGADGVEVLSLTELFGERAMAEPLACIAEALLQRFGRS